MLQKNLLVCALMLQAILMFAQIQDKTLPPSIQFQQVTNGGQQVVIAPPLQLPALDNDSLKMAVTAGLDSRMADVVIGSVLNYNIDFFQNATRIDLENGQRIWRVNIVSPTAEALQVMFSKFQLPAQGKLYLYNSDHSMVMGAYTATSSAHMPTDTFTIQSIDGGNIYLEYTEGVGITTPSATIKISKVAHFFSSIYRIESGDNPQAPCNIDVACPLGNGWGQEIKAAVLFHAFRVVGHNEVVIIGSGTLLNSKTAPFKPYLLTAFHITDNLLNNSELVEYQDPNIPNPVILLNSLTLYYNYQSSTCGGIKETPDYFDSYTTIGGRMVSYSHYLHDGDFCLIEIGLAPPSSEKICYAGWDRTAHDPDNPSDIVGTEFTGIHHPQTKQKRISRTTIRADHVSYRGNHNPYWYAITWQQGITEGGSSGSALFNQSHRVIGALTGGTSACDNLQGRDSYYKFSNAWEKDNWGRFLAPNDPTTITMDTYCPVNFCTNNVKDPGETGVDCGGSCPNVCGVIPPSIRDISISTDNNSGFNCISNNSRVRVTPSLNYPAVTIPGTPNSTTLNTPTIEWTVMSGNVLINGATFLRYTYAANQSLSMPLDCSDLFQNGLIREVVTIVATLFDDQGINRGSFRKTITLKKGIDNFPSNGSLITNQVCQGTSRTLGFTSSSAYTYAWTCPSNSEALEALQGGPNVGMPVFSATKMYQFGPEESMLMFELEITNPSGCSNTLKQYVRQNNFSATMPASLNVCTSASLPITLRNGPAPYTFTWTNTAGGATPEITNANTATPTFTAISRVNKNYTVLIKDAGNCSVTLPLAVTYRKTNIQSMSGMSYNVCAVSTVNGSQMFAGGTAPYSFSSGGSAPTLAAYNYTLGPDISTRTVVVTDADGCRAISTFTTTTPTTSPLTITNLRPVTQSEYLRISPPPYNFETGVGYFTYEACRNDSVEFEADFDIEGGCPPYSFYWTGIPSDVYHKTDNGPLATSNNPYGKKIKFKVPPEYNTDQSPFFILTLVAKDARGVKDVRTICFFSMANPVQPTLTTACNGSDVVVNAANYNGGQQFYSDGYLVGISKTSWIPGEGINLISQTGNQAVVRLADFSERNITFTAKNACGTYSKSLTLNKLEFKINGQVNNSSVMPIKYNYGKSRVMLDATIAGMCFPNYLVTVQECDAGGATIAGSTEYNEWINVTNYAKPSALDIDAFCTQKGGPLQEGKYYRVKIALGTFGWKETVQRIFMVPCNPALSYTINGKPIGVSNPLIVIAKDEPVIMNAGASSTCQAEYFVSVEECNRYGQVANLNPASEWILYYGSPYTLSAFDIRKFCISKNYPLGCEKYYKVKLATGGGSGWQELGTIIYVETCVEAGPTLTACQDGAQLSASGASQYTWTASPTLSATNIPNPIATPMVNTEYEVSSVDPVTGKLVKDNMRVVVREIPQAIVAAETNICTDARGYLSARVPADALQNYSWQPATGLSSTTVAQPSINIRSSQTYTLTVRNNSGCTITRQTHVKVGEQCSSPMFDGVSTVIKIPNHTSYSTKFNNFTLEAWVQLPAQNTSKVAIMSSRSNATTGFLWALTDNGQKMTMTSNGSTATSIAFPSILDEQCHLLSVTRSDNQAYFYIDGIVVGSIYTDNTLYNKLSIPANIMFGNDAVENIPLKGIISEIRMWNVYKGRSIMLADAYKAHNSSTANLAGYYRFQQDNTQIVMDESSTFNHGYYGTSPSDTDADPLRGNAVCRANNDILTVTVPNLNYATVPLLMNYTTAGFPSASPLLVYISDANGNFSTTPIVTISSSYNAGSYNFNISALPNGTNYQIKITNYSGTIVRMSNVFSIIRPNAGLLYTNGTVVATIQSNNSKYNLGTGNFTLEAWVNFSALRSPENICRAIVSRRVWQNNVNKGFVWAMWQGGQMLFGINDVNTYSDPLPNALYDNQCHFVVVRRINGQITFFVDGVSKGGGTNARDISASGANLLIGRDYAGSPMYGYIQEVRFWRKGRTNSEIQNGANALYSTSNTELMGYWRFREENIQTITDESANPVSGYLGSTALQDYNDPSRSYMLCSANPNDRVAETIVEETLSNTPVLSCYPNPFDYTLSVFINDASEKDNSATISIVNLQGVEVYNGVIGISIENKLEFNAPPGLYIALVQYAGNMYQQKILRSNEE